MEAWMSKKHEKTASQTDELINRIAAIVGRLQEEGRIADVGLALLKFDLPLQREPKKILGTIPTAPLFLRMTIAPKVLRDSMQGSRGFVRKASKHTAEKLPEREPSCHGARFHYRFF
jgi:hypothetical protein